MFIEIGRWRVPKENSEKQLEFWREFSHRYLQGLRGKLPMMRSRIFTLAEEESSEETWIFIDEDEDREAYDKTMKTLGISEGRGAG